MRAPFLLLALAITITATPLDIICRINSICATKQLPLFGTSLAVSQVAQSKADGLGNKSVGDRLAAAGYNWTAWNEYRARLQASSDEGALDKVLVYVDGHPEKLLGNYETVGVGLRRVGSDVWFVVNVASDGTGAKDVPDCSGPKTFKSGVVVDGVAL